MENCGSNVGRPSMYKPGFAALAEKLARLGATDTELANFFDVNVRTLQNWKLRHAEFLHSVKAGKDEADARVERALYQRAVGFERTVEKLLLPRNATHPIKARHREQVLPDVTACIFWLKNRRSKEWRDKQDHEHTGSNGGPIQSEHRIVFVDPKDSA